MNGIVERKFKLSEIEDFKTEASIHRSTCTLNKEISMNDIVETKVKLSKIDDFKTEALIHSLCIQRVRSQKK